MQNSEFRGHTHTEAQPPFFSLSTIHAEILKHHTHTHTHRRRQVYLRASSPASSGRKQCGEFIMQMLSLSLSVGISYRTTWPNLWCRFKRFFTWMKGWMCPTHTHTETHMRDSRLCLNKLPSPGPTRGVIYTLKETINMYSMLNFVFPVWICITSVSPARRGKKIYLLFCTAISC